MRSTAAGRFLNILGSTATTTDGFTDRAILKRGSATLGASRTAEIAEHGEGEIAAAAESSGSTYAKEHLPRLLADGRSGLDKLQRDGAEADLTPDETIGLEAIVIATGARPSMPLTDCALDLDDSRLGIWRQATQVYSVAIAQVCRSVGRINSGESQVGTGFAVGSGLVLTNRHVLQALADQDAQGAWTLRKGVSIDFAGGGEQASGNTFAVSKVVMTTDRAIDPTKIDFTKIDLAVLECDVDDRVFPGRLTLESSKSDVIEGRYTYAIGFPGTPAPGAEEFSVLRSIFDFKFGVKRYSPGQIEQARLEDDTKQTVFSHDCTTLGGSSGSAIVDLGEDGLRVVGLHFGGNRRLGNYAHSVAAVRNLLADYAFYIGD